MTVAARLAAIAIVFGSASAARAEPDACSATTPSGFYSCLRDSTIRTRRQQIQEVERADRDSQVPGRAPSLSTANAATVAELAQAAINTSVDGADAGISLSPLALLGHPDSAVQIPVTFAALKDGGTRLQIGVTVHRNEALPVVVGGCILKEEDLDAIERERTPYLEVCQWIKELGLAEPADSEIAATEKKKGFVTTIRRACGLESDPPRTVSTGVAWILRSLKNLKELYASLAQNDPNMAEAQRAIDQLLVNSKAKLGSYKEPGPDECAEQSGDELGEAAVRAVWDKERMRIGLSMRGDLFGRRFGFNPDPSMSLEDGQLKDGEVRIEASYAKRGVDLVAGVGYGASRRSLGDELTGYISPSLSFAWTVASLSRDRLYDKDGEINLVDGALPPRLVVGVDAQLQYAPDPAASQVVKIQKVAVTPFADFRFKERLAFRVGIPIMADLAVRKADAMKAIEAKQDRQWSIPVFVGTVVKF